MSAQRPQDTRGFVTLMNRRAPCVRTPSIGSSEKDTSHLAIAAREFGRIERTQFILDWLQNTDLRGSSTAGLNKGVARHALAKAVFFYLLGEFRGRTFEQQP